MLGVVLATSLAGGDAAASNLDAREGSAIHVSEDGLDLLQSLLVDLDDDGAAETAAAVQSDSSPPHGVTPKPPHVPAPATIVLFGAGLLGLAGLRRRA